MLPTLELSDRSRVRRLVSRASYDRATVHAIMDAAPLCHVSFAVEGQPYVIPTSFARMGDRVVIHGSRASRLIEHAGSGAPLCLAFTLLDGLVLARSAFHHSVNYRSVVAFGVGRHLEERDEKLAALAAVTNHLLPGRWEEVRAPNDRELMATGVIAIHIEEASAKSRSGPPVDDDDDRALPVWAGVVPIDMAYGELQPEPGLPAGVALPAGLHKEDR